MEKTIGVHQRTRGCRPTARAPSARRLRAERAREARNGERTPGKVAVFSTCYVNYNEPGIGHDLLAVLDHNEIPYAIVEKEACCGMPKLELGDLEGVERLKALNIPPLAKLAREGYAILTRGALVHADVQERAAAAVSGRSRRQGGERGDVRPVRVLRACAIATACCKTDFKTGLGKVSYHMPCHSRVQNMGQKTREALQLVPGTTLNTVERCSGHDGTWGVKSEYYENSMKIGRPVFRQMAGRRARLHQLRLPDRRAPHRAGHGRNQGTRAHPLSLLRKAYSI